MECYSCTTENIIVDESWCADKDQLDAHAPASKMTCPGIMNRCGYSVASKDRQLFFFVANITVNGREKILVVLSLKLRPFTFQR